MRSELRQHLTLSLVGVKLVWTMMDSIDGALSTAATHLPPSALPVIAGCATFGSTLALSTLAQWKLLGISTGSPRPIPTVFGMMSVALASISSHGASVKTHAIAKDRYPSLGSNVVKYSDLPVRRTSSSATTRASSVSRHHQSSISSGTSSRSVRKYRPEPRESVSFGPVNVEKQTLRICALGLIAFKLLGGRFWSISPSSFTNLGSFARFSIPATERYATPAERSALERLGRRVGCHTCGSKMRFRKGISFHGDHMPPKAVAHQINSRWHRRLFGLQVKYRFFPQCVDCSAMQGSILSTASNQLKASRWWNSPNLAEAGGGKVAHYHGMRFRPYHLSGGVVAAVTVANANDDAIRDGNRKRYRELDEQVEAFALATWARVRSFVNTKL